MSANLNSNFDTLFNKMENFITSKTVVGEPITIGDIILLPLVDVSFGVGVGASNDEKEKDKKDSGVGGLGAKVTPSAVLVIQNGNVQLVNVKNQDSINKLIDMAPGVLSKLNFNFFKKDKNETEENDKKQVVKEKVEFESTSYTEFE